MFNINIANIFFYTLIIISVLLVPGLIIWRYKNNDHTSKNKASKALFSILYAIAKINSNLLVFYNIVIRKRWKQEMHIHIPGGIIGRNKIYLFSDLTNLRIKKARVLNGDVLVSDNRNEKKLKNVNWFELNVFKKWLINSANLKDNDIIIICLHKGDTAIELHNKNICFIPITIINSYFDWDCNGPIDQEKIHKLIQKNNIIKVNNRKNIRKLSF